MKIFSANQIRKWDEATLNEQGLREIELMERAASTAKNWLLENGIGKFPVFIFCGKGNNGGDGLALARLLIQEKIRVKIFILETGKPGSPAFQENLHKLQLLHCDLHFLPSAEHYPVISNEVVVIDALFGTGLNRPLTGNPASLVKHINVQSRFIISLDVPSGMLTDEPSDPEACIRSRYTLSFQQYKLAFLIAENSRNTGEVIILPIGLSETFEENETTAFELINEYLIRSILPYREKTAHKGNFGHTLLVAGSEGMMGAALLAAKGCMQMGTGKLTCQVPAIGYTIMQTGIPEAMCLISGEKVIEQAFFPTAQYTAMGIGPGLGKDERTINWFRHQLVQQNKNLVLDADALNIIAEQNDSPLKIPSGSIITPHPLEFDRLFGKSGNGFERLNTAIAKAAELNIYIILKGHYTAIITPMKKVYFNPTGNPGMAKAGMGDVLTGMVTGLLARKMALPEAALLAVYIHGLAGDIVASSKSMEAMQASDLINAIPEAWKYLLSN